MRVILFLLILKCNNIYCQVESKSDLDLNKYIRTTEKIIDLIQKDDITGVWSYSYYTNQDTSNLRLQMNSVNRLIKKNGRLIQDAIKIELTETRLDEENNVRKYIDVVYPLNDEETIIFTFANGYSRFIAILAHEKSDYQDFLEFQKNLDTNE